MREKSTSEINKFIKKKILIYNFLYYVIIRLFLKETLFIKISKLNQVILNNRKFFSCKNNNKITIDSYLIILLKLLI